MIEARIIVYCTERKKGTSVESNGTYLIIEKIECDEGGSFAIGEVVESNLFEDVYSEGTMVVYKLSESNWNEYVCERCGCTGRKARRLADVYALKRG